ncbi:MULTISPECIES: CAP domain-containing protein [unclassified Streptomyces]|uniref:CAP domain-containing protein n=1 Tax=unclassified Streptomyces TaxID=2593676 RepID=UPI0038632A84|nr:CAP domain-containing protein [Streptomyces sp. NBC_01017]WSV34865.1 CAP domain-containing protein [Streptomyces sp. NBC_01017]
MAPAPLGAWMKAKRAAGRRPPGGLYKRARRRRRAAVAAVIVALCVSAAGVTQLLSRSTHTPSSPRGPVTPTPSTTLPEGLRTGPPAVTLPTAAGTTPAVPSAGTPTPHSTTPGPTDPALQVITLLNAERTKGKCRPITYNSTLAKAAQVHSADMALRGYFDHVGPDGIGPGERLTAAGYRWSAYGENIARGQANPPAVVKAWVTNPHNRANIANCSFTQAGVGMYSAPGGPWWTLILASTGARAQ